MRTRTLVALVSVAVALVSWSQARSRHGLIDRVHSQSAIEGPVLILHGTLSPMVTNQISTQNLNLIVPVNSWVQKGQVIGETDSCDTPQQIGEARLVFEEANAALVEEQDKIEEIDEDLVSTRAETSYIESQLMSSEADERQTAHESERSYQLLRLQLMSRLEYGATVSAHESAVNAVAALQARLNATSRRIEELDTRSRDARSRLTAVTERVRAAHNALQQMETNGQSRAVISPSDGFVVVNDSAVGSFGIAADATRLQAHANVPQRDLMSIRVGQKAFVTVDNEPAATFDATVMKIAQRPIDSHDGAAYPVTLSVSNPQGGSLVSAAVLPATVRVIPEIPSGR